MLDPWEPEQLSQGGNEQKKHFEIPPHIQLTLFFKTKVKSKCRQSLIFGQSQWGVAAHMLENLPLF